MARLQQGRKYGFSKGWLDAVNLQVGSGTLSGGTLAVVYEKPFKDVNNPPTVIIKATETLADDSVFAITASTNEGFTVVLSTGSATAGFNWMAVDNRYPNHRGGMHSGYVKCKNIQSGIEVIATDGGGNGTAQEVVFRTPFKNIPIVFLTVQEANTTGKVWISTKPTRGGFTMDVTGSSVTSDDLSIGFVAIDMEIMGAQGSKLDANLQATGDYKDQMTMHRAGFKGGYVRCYNIQSGYNTIATDSNGDGTAEAIALRRRMGRSTSLERTPICFAEPQEADATGNVAITSEADTGFTLDVADSAVVSANLTVGWVAISTSAVLTD